MNSVFRSVGVQLAMLLLVTMLAYGATLQNDYVHLDDTNYILFNPLVTDFSAERFADLFTDVRGNFTPLTWLTHILAWQISGEVPIAHHALSLLLHLINVVLVYLLVRALQSAGILSRLVSAQSQPSEWLPLFVALLFALHPQNVEAVAWIAARKDLLMCSFAITTVIAWLRYAAQPGLWLYLATLGLFLLACLAKPTAALLVPVLFILDVAVNRQPAWRVALSGGILRAIPFALVAVAVGTFAYQAQIAAAAIGSDPGFAMSERVFIVLKNYCSYFVRYFLPIEFMVNYPLNKDFSLAVVGGLAGAAVLAGGLAFKRTRAMALAWLCTVILLLPSVGIIQYGIQATADRFTYLAFIPMHVWLVCIAHVGLQQIEERRVLLIARACVVLALLLLFQLTLGQTRVWRDDMSLWAHGITVQPGNPLAYQYLGDAFLRRDENELALRSFAQSSDLASAGVYMDTRALFFSQGRAHYGLGEYAAAYERFDQLLQDDPQSFDRIGYVYYFLADILARRGQLEQAAEYAQQSVRLIPDYARAAQLNAELQQRLVQ